MIFIKSSTNKTFAVDLNPETTTLSAVKHHIQSRFLIPLSLQRFLLPSYFNPKPLNTDNNNNDTISDSLLLSQIGINRYSTLTMYIPFLGGGTQPPQFLNSKSPPPNDDDDDENEKFDEFEGNDVGLLASAVYDGDDKEADAVWDEIDKIMHSRRKDRRESKLKLQIHKCRDSSPKITEQFSDLKRKLHTLSAQDWESMPDIVLRNKKKKNGAAVGTETTPSSQITSDAVVISDTRKHRLLFKKLIHTNPKCPSTWIAAARLEKVDGKLQAARQVIQRGCEEGPINEDVWLEACRLASPDDDAIANQTRVLRRGLEHISDSVRLWKDVVELSNEKEESRKLLYRAVECCPFNLELWFALTRLETYDNAKKVLNRARMKLSKEPAIWVTAAKLEEANGNTSMVGKIIGRGIRALEREGLVIDKEAWIKEAEAAERAGSVLTCQAIVMNTIGVGVVEEDRKRTWVADAEDCKKRGSIETARAIYAHALTIFSTKKSIWLKAAQLEKSHGTRLDALLRKAGTCNPQVEALWLMGAKEKCLYADVPATRAILQEAYTVIPNSKEILLAAFKLEFENHEPKRARLLLHKARERGGTERMWMKSAIVERELGNTEEERRLLDEGLKQFPSFFKLWLMLGQLEERLSHLGKAKEVYESGLKHCSSSIQLWLSLANLEEKMTALSKAREVLTMARKKNPHNPELWFASVRAESRHRNKKEAEILMAKALQECPNSGILWAALIEMVPRPQRQIKSVDALKKCHKDPHVIAAVAKFLWHQQKVDQPRFFLNRAVTLAPDIGDFWALYYKFEIQPGTEEDQKDVLKRCIAAEPKHGERWQTIAKAVENAHQRTEAILKKVVVALGKEDNAKNSGTKLHSSSGAFPHFVSVGSFLIYSPVLDFRFQGLHFRFRLRSSFGFRKNRSCRSSYRSSYRSRF